MSFVHPEVITVSANSPTNINILNPYRNLFFGFFFSVSTRSLNAFSSPSNIEVHNIVIIFYKLSVYLLVTILPLIIMEEKELIAFLTTSKNRLKVLKLLNEEGTSRPVILAKKFKVTQPYISTLLYQLTKAGLTECHTKEKKSWRVYGITKLGQEILKKIR